MQITDIKIRKTFAADGPMKAVVSVTFDGQLALHIMRSLMRKPREQKPQLKLTSKSN